MSGSYPSWQDAGQRDLRDLHLWYCGTKLRYMYSASVFPGESGKDTAHLRNRHLEALCDARDRTGIVPHCLYYETDAFFHAGCSGTGLYENRYGEGSKTFLPSVQACTEKCTAPRYHLCRSYDGLYYDRKLRSREDFHDPGLGNEFVSSIINRDYTIMVASTTPFWSAQH